MFEYARIENNKVVNVEVWDSTPTVSGTFVDITSLDSKPGIGWDYDGSVFTNPDVVVDTRPYLHVTLGSSEINVGNTVTIDAKLTVDAGPDSTLVNFNGSRKFTIINSMGASVRIKLSFAGGVATQKTLTVQNSGIYTIDQKSTDDAQVPQSVILDVLG